MIDILSVILSPMLVFVAFLIGRWLDQRNRKEDKEETTLDELKALIEGNTNALETHITETEARDDYMRECLTIILKNQLWETYYEHKEDKCISFDIYQRASNAWHGYHDVLGENHEMTDVWKEIESWYKNS